MTPAEYLSQTEKSTIQLFESLKFYHDLIKDSLPPIFISSGSDGIWHQKEFEKWEADNHEKIEYSLKKQNEYFGYTVSQGAICGSILQIAFMGILKFSDNENIPVEATEIVTKGSKPVSFCVGRQVRGLPIGLVIYAARNQYNHMDEDKYNKVTTKVFDHIAFEISNGEFKDPAFDLENPKLTNYAHNALGLLKWNDYESYLKDMNELINQ